MNFFKKLKDSWNIDDPDRQGFMVSVSVPWFINKGVPAIKKFWRRCLYAVGMR